MATLGIGGVHLHDGLEDSIDELKCMIKLLKGKKNLISYCDYYYKYFKDELKMMHEKIGLNILLGKEHLNKRWANAVKTHLDHLKIRWVVKPSRKYKGRNDLVKK